MISLAKLCHELLILTILTSTIKAYKDPVCTQLQSNTIGISILSAFNSSHLMLITTDGNFFHLPADRLNLSLRQLDLSDIRSQSMWSVYSNLPKNFSFYPTRFSPKFDKTTQRLLLVAGDGPPPYAQLTVFRWAKTDGGRGWKKTTMQFYDLTKAGKSERKEDLCPFGSLFDKSNYHKNYDRNWIENSSYTPNFLNRLRCGPLNYLLALSRAPTAEVASLSFSDWYTMVVSIGRGCFFAYLYTRYTVRQKYEELGRLEGYFLDFNSSLPLESFNCWPVNSTLMPDAGMVWLDDATQRLMLFIWNLDSKLKGRVSLARRHEANTSESNPRVAWLKPLDRPQPMNMLWTVSMESFIVCSKKEKPVGENSENDSSDGSFVFLRNILPWAVLMVILALCILFFAYRLLFERFSFDKKENAEKEQLKRKTKVHTSSMLSTVTNQLALKWSKLGILGGGGKNISSAALKKSIHRPFIIATNLSSTAATPSTSFIPIKVSTVPISSLVNRLKASRRNRRKRKNILKRSPLVSRLQDQVTSRLSQLRSLVSSMVAKSRAVRKRK